MSSPFVSAAPSGNKPMSARFGSSESPAQEVQVKRDQWGRPLVPELDRSHPAVDSETGHVLEVFTPPTSWRSIARTRCTTLAKTIGDTFTLSQWGKRMAVKGLSIRPDLVALAASTSLANKSALDDIVKQAEDAASIRASANLGTALHSFTEQSDRGEDPYVPAPFDRDVAAYRAALAAHGITVAPEYMERQVINDGIGAGGMFDRIVQWQGRWIIGDLKTGKDLQYGWNEIAIQLWIYAMANAIWGGHVELGGDGKFYPMPQGIDTEKALVFHLPVGQGRCDVYEVDLREAAAAARLCVDVRKWRNTRNLARLLSVVEAPAIEDGNTIDAEVIEVLTSDDVQRASALGRAVQASVLKAADQAGIGDSDDVAPGSETGGRQLESTVISGPGAPGHAEQMAASDRDGTGAPLARRKAEGERGCSVCSRVGHKKGSPKCLGDADPALREEAAQRESMQQHDDGKTEYGTVPETDFPGQVTEDEFKASTPQVTVQQGMPSGELHTVTTTPDRAWCTHTAADGREWTMPPAGSLDGAPWVCTLCGKPARAGQLDGSGKPLEVSASGFRAVPGVQGRSRRADVEKLARTMIADAAAAQRAGKATIGDVALLAGNEAEVYELWTAQPDPEEEPVTPLELAAAQMAAKIVSLGAEDVPGVRGTVVNAQTGEDEDDVQPDPLAEFQATTTSNPEPVVVRPPTWIERLSKASNAGELTAIGREAMEAGAWTDELKAFGKARMAKLAEPAG